MTNINYNEFQAGQGVSAPALNENFTLTNNAIESLTQSLNSSITSLTSTTNLKANKNGSSAEKFNVSDAEEDTQAVNLGQLNDMLAPVSPIGSVIWYAGTSAPEGYLLCDGSAISRTTYSNLFSILGVRFGAGDASTTFNLPDLIGKFIEGASSSGTYKQAGLPNITGQFGLDDRGAAYYSGAFSCGASGDYGSQGSEGGNIMTFDASRLSSVYGRSATVQPASLTLLPYIRY